MRLNPSLHRSSELFLGNIASGWPVEADQSDLNNFRLSDLQTSKMDLSGTTLLATMKHKKGVAEIELKTATYYAIVEANNGTSTITRTSNTNESVKASNSFASTGSYHVPVQKGSTDYYYAVVQTGTATTQFNSNSGTDQWASAYTATEIASGGLGHFDAYSTRVGTSTYSGQFSYSGTYLTFTVPFTGTYTIECWGASGGNANESYGNGAYTKGTISLSKNDNLYVYIGKRGDAAHTATTPTASYNGGGRGIKSSHANSLSSGSGGGATDIRTKSGLTDAQNSSWTTDWNNTYGLRGRLMVAAGGGGASGNSDNASSGGGLNSNATPANGGSSGSLRGCTGASQTAGGTTSSGRVSGSIAYTAGENGTFGVGGAGGSSNNINCGAGGGGGYWGGAGGGSGNVGMAGISGSGGSSYISGHPGCVAIISASSTAASTAGTVNSVERATHYSGLKFTNTKMIDGAGYAWTTAKGSIETMPTPPGGTISSGNVGNGYCRITGTTAAL